MYNFSRSTMNGLYNEIHSKILNSGSEGEIRYSTILSLDHVTAELSDIRNKVLHNTVFDIGFALDELYCILNEIQPRSYVSKDQLQRTMGTSSRIMFFGNELREALSRWSLLKILNLFRKDIHTNKAFLDLNTRRPTLHVPCLVGVHFYVRDNKFCCNLISRGTELNYGFIYDTFIFSQIQEMIYYWLLYFYQDLELGSFFYTTSNLHLYVNSEDHEPIITGDNIEIDTTNNDTSIIQIEDNELNYEDYLEQMSLLNMFVEYLYKHIGFTRADLDSGYYSTFDDVLYFIDENIDLLDESYKTWFRIIHHQYSLTQDNKRKLLIYYNKV